MNPKVSVVMSVYNGEKYLSEAIESILNQTFTDFEFIIIDDASTDKTASILRNFSYKDPRIKIITNEKNLGLTKSLNLGIKASRGEYIARMDADDISFSERFEKQVKFLNENPDYGVVGAWAKVIDEEGNEIGEFKYPTNNEKLKKVLINYNPFIHSAVMIRKSIIENVGNYNEGWKYAQDYELFFRIASKSNISNLPEFLLQSRAGTYSITRKKNKIQANLSLKARWQAIKRGEYPFYYAVFLLRPVASMLLPYKIRKFLKS